MAAGIDQELMMLEGIRLFTNAAAEKGRTKASAAKLVALAETLSDANLSFEDRLHAAESKDVADALAKQPIRTLITHSDEFEIYVERVLAGSGAWYEFFPRSEGAKFNTKTGEWTSGTFKTAAKRLPAVAAMGFDVLYMPPIHPIGRSHRKGPNNTLVAGEQDPGSPWAIGSEAGGHDAIHPDLGTVKDFEKFVKEANALGIEIAMDFALQASPDHPWVKSNPEWFTTRADGTIAYATVNLDPSLFGGVIAAVGSLAELSELIEILADDEDALVRVLRNEALDHTQLARRRRCHAVALRVVCGGVLQAFFIGKVDPDLFAHSRGDEALLLDLFPWCIETFRPDEAEDIRFAPVFAHEGRSEPEASSCLEFGRELENRRRQEVHLVVDHETPVEGIEQSEVCELTLTFGGQNLIRRNRDRLNLFD